MGILARKTPLYLQASGKISEKKTLGCNVNSVRRAENKLAAGTAWGMRRYHALINVSNNYSKHLLLGSQWNTSHHVQNMKICRSELKLFER